VCVSRCVCGGWVLVCVGGLCKCVSGFVWVCVCEWSVLECV